MKFSFSHKLGTAALVLAVFSSVCFQPIDSYAAKKKQPTAAEIAAAEQAERERQEAYDKAVDSNEIENWPQGPQIYAEAAVIMEADTGAILYNKDMDMRNYPASITKIMTALLALEDCSLDEVITYSYYATHSIEAGSSTIYTKEGEQLTVEESLYGLLLESANECGNGLAEHVAGSVEAFVDMMNERAAELGCTDTHFMNPHGLHDEEHYTTPRDMALIMQAAIQNENFLRISGTAKYELAPTNMDEEISYMTNHHSMIAPYKGTTKYLDDTVIAGKTGGTSAAKNTLVTAAERNGMTLIVVTMRTASTNERGVPLFTDTALLLDYASDNFTKLNVASNETNFSVDNSSFFHTGSSIFGRSKSLVEINKSGNIILPNEVSFSDASPELTFTDNEDSDTIATLSYTYQGVPVGSASIQLVQSELQEFTFDRITGEEEPESEDQEQNTKSKKFIHINIRLVLLAILLITCVLLLYVIIRGLSKHFHLTFRLPRRKYRHPRQRQRSNLQFKNRKAKGRAQKNQKKKTDSFYDLDL
ncbi:MAG: D-alanyl-D-alanine carboxypeptidase [Lachnospiraceae bacterium]|jgi:D-alanyl-D-alanine carboxypeptidase (penicillin-binding protein 5/6)|nr:D-alanyl-D-alanine carboxypeptidase [Lachnospiraceae bacterium]